jgi:predicted  nucleic acid-binding Zn-ribbon protein
MAVAEKTKASVEEELRDEIASLKTERDELSGQVDDLEDQLKEAREEIDAEAASAVNAFLDEVQRPTGKLTFTVPVGPNTDRAILGLYDVIGRKL